MPAAIAIPAIVGAVGAGTSLIGAAKQAGAANSAAQIQAEAAAKAGQQVTDAVDKVNPQITQAATTGSQQANDAAAAAAADANAKAAAAGQGVTDAATQANNLLNPYTSAGADAAALLKAGIAEGGAFNKTPTLADLQLDPGYAFRLQQGQQQLERSAAARGMAASGAALKDLTNYAQGAASQEYQNAFNRFRQSTQDHYSNLMGVSQAGQAAAGTQGGNLLGAAKYAGDTGLSASEFGGRLTSDAAQFGAGLNYGAATTTAANTIGGAKTAADYLTQGANAQAAGKVGAANAWASGLTGVGNAVAGGAGLYNLLKNPGQKSGSTRYV